MFLSDDALMVQFVQQLPEHLIISSSDVRMLDIPLGQGTVASVSDATYNRNSFRAIWNGIQSTTCKEGRTR